MKAIKSFGHAFAGLTAAFREELNLKIHLAATVMITATGFYLHFTYVEWCVISLACGLVISLELANTAIENLVDFITHEKNPMAGKIKDFAAAAVLVASLSAGVAGVIILSNHLIK